MSNLFPITLIVWSGAILCGWCNIPSILVTVYTSLVPPPPPHIASSSLCAQLISPPSHIKASRDPHTLPPLLGYGGLGVRPLASVWTFGDHPGIQTDVRIKHDFTSVPKSSWLWRKLHQKVQLFQSEGGGMLYWPACWVAYKRKSWRAWISVCSQWWTPPHLSWTQPELHHLDTVCWISKFPPMPHSFGRTLINRDALSNLSGKLGRTLQPGARAFHPGAGPFQSIKQLWVHPDKQGAHSSILVGILKHTLSHLWKKPRN
jgi:hypothetical protein